MCHGARGRVKSRGGGKGGAQGHGLYRGLCIEKNGQSHKVRPTSGRIPIWALTSLGTKSRVLFDKEGKLGDASWSEFGKRDKHPSDALDGANPNTPQIRTQEIIGNEAQGLAPETFQRQSVIAISGAVGLSGGQHRSYRATDPLNK